MLIIRNLNLISVQSWTYLAFTGFACTVVDIVEDVVANETSTYMCFFLFKFKLTDPLRCSPCIYLIIDFSAFKTQVRLE